MPELSVIFIRTSLIYLLTGFCIGATILVNKALFISPKIFSLLPVHIYFMLFGYFIQFIFGVAFWIMPRFGSSYGNEKRVYISYFLLNGGLLILAIYYLNKVFIIFENRLNILNLIAIAMIFTGIFLYASYIWKRVRKIIIQEL